MCMQCVADSAVYVGGAVGALQVLKVRARRRRAVPVGTNGTAAPAPPADRPLPPLDRG